MSFIAMIPNDYHRTCSLNVEPDGIEHNGLKEMHVTPKIDDDNVENENTVQVTLTSGNSESPPLLVYACVQRIKLIIETMWKQTTFLTAVT